MAEFQYLAFLASPFRSSPEGPSVSVFDSGRLRVYTTGRRRFTRGAAGRLLASTRSHGHVHISEQFVGVSFPDTH